MCFDVLNFIVFVFYKSGTAAHSMQQSPLLEVNSSAASKGVPCIIWHHEAQCCVHKSLFSVLYNGPPYESGPYSPVLFL